MTEYQRNAIEAAAAIRHHLTVVAPLTKTEATAALHDVAAELRNRMNIINANLLSMLEADFIVGEGKTNGALADIRDAIQATCLIADAFSGKPGDPR